MRARRIMMFSKADLQIKSADEFFEFLPIVVFIALIAPFLIAAYTLGFFMDITAVEARFDESPPYLLNPTNVL